MSLKLPRNINLGKFNQLQLKALLDNLEQAVADSAERLPEWRKNLSRDHAMEINQAIVLEKLHKRIRNRWEAYSKPTHITLSIQEALALYADTELIICTDELEKAVIDQITATIDQKLV